MVAADLIKVCVILPRDTLPPLHGKNRMAIGASRGSCASVCSRLRADKLIAERDES